eukprot:gene11607-4850_t
MSINNNETTTLLPSETKDKKTVEKKRILSLDFVRGFTVCFMILGNFSLKPKFKWLEHVDWNGWELIDLVFPFFLWIVGYSIGIAYRNIRINETETKIFGIKMKSSNKEHLMRWYKILKRTFLLFFFGLILNLSNSRFIFWEPFRIPGVLQRISLCFFFITCLHILVENIFLQCLIISLMQFIYLFGMFMVKGIITAECSGSGYIDRLIFPSGFLYKHSATDPEGILSAFSAITTTYFGLIYFYISKHFKSDSYKKLTYWFSLGIVLVLIGSHGFIYFYIEQEYLFI